jgi:hypothetical protein
VKPFNSILTPDSRSASIYRDAATGELRPMIIDDLHRLLQPHVLGPPVPLDISKQFDLALDTFLYSWFSYELVTLAEGQSYSVLEMALKERLQASGRVLRGKETMTPLLEMAVKDGMLRHSDFEIPAANGLKQLSLLELIPKFRNDLTHGSTRLFPMGSLEMIRLCAAIIRILFPVL